MASILLKCAQEVEPDNPYRLFLDDTAGNVIGDGGHGLTTVDHAVFVGVIPDPQIGDGVGVSRLDHLSETNVIPDGGHSRR